MDIFSLRAVTGCLGAGVMVIGPNIRSCCGDRVFGVPVEHLPMAVIEGVESRPVALLDVPFGSKSVELNNGLIFCQPWILARGPVDRVNNPLTGLIVGCIREKRQAAVKLSRSRHGGRPVPPIDNTDIQVNRMPDVLII